MVGFLFGVCMRVDLGGKHMNVHTDKTMPIMILSFQNCLRDPVAISPLSACQYRLYKLFVN